MTVSACMIVKNEEKLLARAIDCFKDIVDEIVIVDTGSTDKTKEIAKKYTDKIYDFEWCDDFSAARNFAFSKASMDYIFIPDADEVIDEKNRQKFKHLKENLSSDIEIVQMKYVNQLQFATVYNFDVELRAKMFKRLRNFNWIDPVHETVDTELHIYDSDIEIIHKPENSHSGRDFTIFEKNARVGKKLSQRLHHLYAQELFVSGRDKDFLNAYDYFEWTLHEESLTSREIKESECVVAKCCNLKKDANGLFKVALKNVVGTPSAEVCCELGDYYYGKKDYEEAAIWFYTAAFGADSELSIHSSGDLPLKKLSECYKKLDNKEEALKYKKMAEDWQPQKILE